MLTVYKNNTIKTVASAINGVLTTDGMRMTRLLDPLIIAFGHPCCLLCEPSLDYCSNIVRVLGELGNRLLSFPGQYFLIILDYFE